MNRGFLFIKKNILGIASQLPTNKLRCTLYRLCNIKIGKRTCIEKNAKIKFGNLFGNNIQIESNTFIQYTSIGNCSKIDYGTFLIGVKKNRLEIGKHTYIGYYNILDGSGNLTIGNYVHISSPSVGIWTHSSVYQSLCSSELGDPSFRKEGPVKIEDNVWIGGKVTIYPNVTIGQYSVVLPNTVINKDVPPFSMVGGIPAKIIKKIKVNEETIEFIPTEIEKLF
ncbi:Acetyltransferase [Methanosarcina siciliae T4/M]|uniref:Acetyltransferase n=1 Tax=Methanosarcina siciliae T4/M TaxID=1434120 RepID=A0A0E3P916_9EURY|nr:acyltransferase [Methanosarcina siciliae]AKB30495.1 Acetyltransferase [Methanosarcina siciliae T4/M]